MNPRVSVVMITYNQGAYVGQAIEGVLAQRICEPFEFVIGEDCSTDGTREIVQSYSERFPDIIRIITDSKNVGMNENFRRAALAAEGEFVAFHEGDDVRQNP